VKPRNLLYPKTRLVTVTQSNGTRTATETRRNAYFDSLSIAQDYTGPVQRDVVHAHEFTKQAGTMEWQGVFSEYVFGRTTEIRGTTAINFGTTFTLNLVGGNELYNSALSAAYDAVRGQVDVAVTAAEASSTLQMKRQLERQTWKAFTAIGRLKRSLGRAFNQAPDIGSNAWLTYTYGIRPIISDIYNTADNLRRALPEDMVVRVRRSESESRSWSSTIPNANYLPPQIVSEWVKRRVEVVLKYKIPDSVLTTAGDWTSLNPVSIGWELLPYSFVIDWFVDVGGYLRNLESAALYASAFRGGYVTQGYKAGIEARSQGRKTDGPYLYFSDIQGARTVSWKKRLPLASNPRPRTPGFKVDLGWKQLVSAASLIQARPKVPHFKD